MGKFSVIGDADIKQLLLNLSTEEVKYFLKVIEDCLISYSCGDERQYQPNAGIINRPEGQKILFRPFTSPDTVGAKIIVHAAPEPSDTNGPGSDGVKKQNKLPPLRGGLVLCDQSGVPTGFLNAEEVTGYRTTLSAMLPFMFRHRVINILIFGAGKQALWHSRLALALRGGEVASITIINRSEPRARELINTVQEENKSIWKSKAQLDFLSSFEHSQKHNIQSAIAKADVIFCTVASQEPLFSLDALALERRERYPLITAVGSWQADMIEVHPDILHHVIRSKSVVLVDDAKTSLTHSGEIVQSGLTLEQILEIGYILRQRSNSELDDDQENWLAEGLVVYKSIGVSMTDLAAGNAILALAEKNDKGTKITDF